jgi:hypothetical protein
MEKMKLYDKDKFKKIWDLFDQVSPRIKKDLLKRINNGPRR